MVRAVEQIERDIAALEQAIADLAEDFHKTYSSYLTALGQAVKQQLILASYHLCTQGYPKAFLQLSFSQRQQLQQELRSLAQQTQTKLLSQLQDTDPGSSAEIETEELLPSEANPLTDNLIDLDEGAMSTPTGPGNPVTVAVPPNVGDFQAALDLAAFSLSSMEAELSAQMTSEQPLSSSERLAHWQEQLEQAIAAQLQTVSHDANRLLQQSGILPQKLPEPILEAAVKSEAADSVAGPPNLLNLLVETAGASGTKKSSEGNRAALHVIAIHLRLSEVEFTDSTVMTWRTKIRNLAVRLNSLGREYDKRQQERAIAEAEAAWRASWCEE